MEVKEGSVTISIEEYFKDKEKLQISCDDNRIVVLDSGEEEQKLAHNFFVIDKEFEKLSIVHKGLVDGEGKAKKSYNYTMQFVTPEELKEYYNKAISIRDQLNE